jgi:hypothetical protein
VITFPASPPQQTPGPPRVDEFEPAFWRRVARLQEAHRQLWWSTDDQTPRLGVRIDPHRQWANARRTRGFIDGMADTMRSYPEGGSGRRAAAESIKATVREYAAVCLGWSAGEQQLFLSDDSFRVTQEFAQEARRFDADIQAEALFQALRNVWIMNGIQVVLGRPLELTPAVFAYSLLYPYTDNPLDSPELDTTTKRAHSERLARRLRGARLEPVDTNEDKVFRLVALIERQYPRPAHPQVYLGLLAIHRAQYHSLDQHGRPAHHETDILGLSLAKGGASVLADGYLVAGVLGDAEAEFLFGYGVMLQLLDDLQDVGADREAGHMTVFSQTADGWPLDPFTIRLLDFMGRVLDSGAARFDRPRAQSLWMAIRRNCTHLLLQAVASNRGRFTAELVQTLESRSPLPFAALDALRRRAERRHHAIKKTWGKKGLGLSVWETLG